LRSQSYALLGSRRRDGRFQTAEFGFGKIEAPAIGI
jgi:hypothetical protein